MTKCNIMCILNIQKLLYKPRTKGSIRFDVVEYDAKGNVVAAYDLKTGSASLTEERIAEMRKHIGSDIPIFEIKPE